MFMSHEDEFLNFLLEFFEYFSNIHPAGVGIKRISDIATNAATSPMTCFLDVASGIADLFPPVVISCRPISHN